MQLSKINRLGKTLYHVLPIMHLILSMGQNQNVFLTTVFVFLLFNIPSYQGVGVQPPILPLHLDVVLAQIVAYTTPKFWFVHAMCHIMIWGLVSVINPWNGGWGNEQRISLPPFEISRIHKVRSMEFVLNTLSIYQPALATPKAHLTFQMTFSIMKSYGVFVDPLRYNCRWKLTSNCSEQQLHHVWNPFNDTLL